MVTNIAEAHESSSFNDQFTYFDLLFHYELIHYICISEQKWEWEGGG